ncbi:hypothetical protein [Polaribacter sp. Hel1_85]|uniref:hypothetical protein n=1 Tax=Polaribacter sp. Hel1_85 TaxID=1250005 RepID=UPI00052E2B26|nr:hypothetical protein [Polaribacter sp. Hel1_85]KGL62004.1 hypothetical protein PHEL85_1791 [Polaribacter sp. Hel1_85]
MDKIEKAIEYYTFKSKELLDFVNSNNNLSIEKIIECGEELAVLENKITALEVAKEN